MGFANISERYDAFQKDAVDAITRDFDKKNSGRFLLVIPTGGGKTYTAVKSICNLFDKGVLVKETDKILWVAHRVELIDQAKNTFADWFAKDDNNKALDIEQNVIFSMLSEISSNLNKNPSTKLVVIDEAHHSAANSYQKIFANPQLGVLGLTATPSRHDGKPLDFEKESYAIGYPDLVKKGVILKPDVHYVKGDHFDIDEFNEKSYEKLNNEKRNKLIINCIQKNVEEYKKIIIFVGTKKHTKDLYELLKASDLQSKYENISYIVGNDNSRNQNRADFIEQEKKYKRSILVNVQVLTEGYDDTKINTVIMATPTKSKLIYMQAFGRAVRRDPEDDLKKSYVVEIDDDLPNIRYRIDNRWLYSEISDLLEPKVEDYYYSNEDQLNEILDNVYKENNVPQKYRKYYTFDTDDRYSALLFKQYVGGKEGYIHYPLLINNESRLKISNLFNFISERSSELFSKNFNYKKVFETIRNNSNSGDQLDIKERLIFDAMENAYSIITGGNINEVIMAGYPWIRYISFIYKQHENAIEKQLSIFIEDMVNKDEIVNQILSKDYVKDSILVRLPLPLGSYIGVIINNREYEKLDIIIQKLKIIKDENGKMDHREKVHGILRNSVLPIEMKYSDSLILIVRENIEYQYKLK